MILNHNFHPIQIEAFHPGETLKEEIETRGLVKKEFAKQLGILPHHLSEIFAGKRDISANMAIKLEKLLGISAEFWYGMQTGYDLFIAKQKQK